VPEPDEVLDDLRHAHLVVHEDGEVVRPPRASVDEHEREAVPPELGDRRVGHEARRDEKPVHLPLA